MNKLVGFSAILAAVLIFSAVACLLIWGLCNYTFTTIMIIGVFMIAPNAVSLIKSFIDFCEEIGKEIRQ